MSDSTICSIDGCDKRVQALGYCCAHRTRFKRHGHPLAGGITPGTARAFLDSLPAASGESCLTWPFARGENGYAVINDDGRTELVSRIICERLHGAPPPGREAAHSCGKGHFGCVEGAHLSWKTPKQNTGDKNSHGTMARGEKHAGAKLTDADVLEIRRMAQFSTHQEIADRFEVCRSLITNVVNRRVWRHVA